MLQTIYKACTWPEITEAYDRAVEDVSHPFAPMLALVQKIAVSRYSTGLYANKSMWNLLVVQTPEYDPHGEILHIAYDPVLREFTFELQETSSTKYKRWTRKSSAKGAFQTFERSCNSRSGLLRCKGKVSS